MDVCRTLKGVDMDIRRTPGTQLINDRTGEVIYTPPEGEARLREMLSNWERFLHEQTELDPLVRMAVGHYQFEAIHPFTDGNGRAARLAMNFVLLAAGFPPISIPTELRQPYYNALEAADAGDFPAWLNFLTHQLDQELDTWLSALDPSPSTDH